MIVVVDTETTGLDPVTASIVEIGTVTVPGFDSFSCLVKPEHQIELPAMAAHHLTEEMVAEGVPLQDALIATMIDKADYLCAHNAAFDSGFVKSDKPWICTYRCARHLWTDVPGYSNQVLRYWLKLDEQHLYDGDGKSIMQLPPHRALPDAWVTAHILNIMLKGKTAEQLVELTKAPILMTTVGFGMHYGKLWSDVPKDYLRWMLKQDFDRDSMFTAKYHLEMIR